MANRLKKSKEPEGSDARVDEINAQVVGLAEQIGRIAGMVEGTAENWLNSGALVSQLTTVRDSAAQLLENVARRAEKARKSFGGKETESASGNGAEVWAEAKGPRDLAHAPGKRHRRPAPTKHGAKKSDQHIPKMRVAKTVRQRRKSYA